MTISKAWGWMATFHKRNIKHGFEDAIKGFSLLIIRCFSSCILIVIINSVPSVILAHSFMTAFILLKVFNFIKMIPLSESQTGHSLVIRFLIL